MYVKPIIERLELEGTLKTIEFQPLCHGQGHLPLDKVSQSPIQPGLEHFQGWSIAEVGTAAISIKTNGLILLVVASFSSLGILTNGNSEIMHTGCEQRFVLNFVYKNACIFYTYYVKNTEYLVFEWYLWDIVGLEDKDGDHESNMIALGKQYTVSRTCCSVLAVASTPEESRVSALGQMEIDESGRFPPWLYFYIPK
ncbi:hypothetical protein llap_9553 [Limosa lapponica baueri]|uniref:Uncharacterized protein n=1 Tax=Limosa lapponica baueri TaxID=1758121 RepID=A0A2I0U286_LIMLA|nr:hypothetical protein llap_9553 [Limosa lapponica baueri]